MFAANNTILAQSPQWQVNAGQEATTLSTCTLSICAVLIQLFALNVRRGARKTSLVAFVAGESQNKSASSESWTQVSVIWCACEVLSLRRTEAGGGYFLDPDAQPARHWQVCVWRPTFDLSAGCSRCDDLRLGACHSFAVSQWNPSILVHVLHHHCFFFFLFTLLSRFWR